MRWSPRLLAFFCDVLTSPEKIYDSSGVTLTKTDMVVRHRRLGQTHRVMQGLCMRVSKHVLPATVLVFGNTI